MNLCNDGHEEVCFDSRHCPVCEIIKDYDDHVERLQDENKDLNQMLTESVNENARYIGIFQEVKASYPEFAI